MEGGRIMGSITRTVLPMYVLHLEDKVFINGYMPVDDIKAFEAEYGETRRCFCCFSSAWYKGLVQVLQSR